MNTNILNPETLSHQHTLQSLYHKTLKSVNPFTNRGQVAGDRVIEAILKGQEIFNNNHSTWRDVFDIWQDKPEKVWVWSDHHLCHKNIIAYAQRPFKSPEEFALAMIRNAQSVAPDDIVIFGGDVSFGDAQHTKQWLSQIPGRKFLIIGNHEIDRKKKMRGIEKYGFESFTDCLALKSSDDRLIYLTHYPLFSHDLSNETINIHGHIHEKIIPDPKFVNMCVEHTNYSPVKLLSILPKINE